MIWLGLPQQQVNDPVAMAATIAQQAASRPSAMIVSVPDAQARPSSCAATTNTGLQATSTTNPNPLRGRPLLSSLSLLLSLSLLTSSCGTILGGVGSRRSLSSLLSVRECNYLCKPGLLSAVRLCGFDILVPRLCVVALLRLQYSLEEREQFFSPQCRYRFFRCGFLFENPLVPEHISTWFQEDPPEAAKGESKPEMPCSTCGRDSSTYTMTFAAAV
eukprot:1993847-Amphidinium_carterae.1